MKSRPLFLQLTLAAGLLTAIPAIASNFPGGEPITAADLIATAPQLPAAPPAYDPAKDSPDHTEFARFAWREFIALNAPAQQVSSPVSGQSPRQLAPSCRGASRPSTAAGPPATAARAGISWCGKATPIALSCFQTDRGPGQISRRCSRIM